RPVRTIARDVGQPNAMAVTPDGGSLVAPLFAAGAAARFDISTGKRTTLATGLRAPTSAKLAPDGRVLVLEGRTGTIRALAGFDAPPADRGAEPGPGDVFAQLPPGLDNLTFCDRSLLVSSFLTGTIYAFRPWDGPSRVLVAGGLAVPSGIALDGSDVLVSDGISIKRISADKVTTEVATVIDALPPPNGLALGSDGAAYVTTSFAGSVSRVDLHT